MTREEAIAIIRKEYLCVDRDCDIEKNCGKCDLVMPSKEPILEAYKMAIKALEQEPRWIPVSERLPEEFESVLVCYKSQGGMAQAVSERFGTHTGYRWSALAGIEPIAWMPLPEPYKSQESEVGE